MAHKHVTMFRSGRCIDRMRLYFFMGEGQYQRLADTFGVNDFRSAERLIERILSQIKPRAITSSLLVFQ